MILLLGTLAGVTVGTFLGDALTGMRTASNISNLRVLAGMMLFSIVPGVAITYFSWANGRLQDERLRVEAAQRQAAEHQLRLLESQRRQRHLAVPHRRQAGIRRALSVPDEPGYCGRHSIFHSAGSK